jgi:hypothetical protein
MTNITKAMINQLNTTNRMKLLAAIRKAAQAQQEQPLSNKKPPASSK